MSPALSHILDLSKQLQALAQAQDWTHMLQVARTRQQQLESYFRLDPLPDAADIVQTALQDVQQTDHALSLLASQHRQHLLQDAVDLRQRWQSSNAYQGVQNLDV